MALEEVVRTEGLPILTFWETVVAVLSSLPANAPASKSTAHSFPKQSFYGPLPSPVLPIHHRDNVSDGHNLYSIAGELMSITPFRFDHVENFFAIREWSGPVDLIIAEDNEATIKNSFRGKVYEVETCTQNTSGQPRLAL